MSKVYIVDCYIDGDEMHNTYDMICVVCSTFEKAQEYLKNRVEQERKKDWKEEIKTEEYFTFRNSSWDKVTYSIYEHELDKPLVEFNDG